MPEPAILRLPIWQRFRTRPTRSGIAHRNSHSYAWVARELEDGIDVLFIECTNTAASVAFARGLASYMACHGLDSTSPAVRGQIARRFGTSQWIALASPHWPLTDDDETAMRISQLVAIAAVLEEQ